MIGMASFGNNTKKNITKHGNLSLEIKREYQRDM
jgi:hypothetical protein